MEGFPWDDLRKILHGGHDGQGTQWRRNIAESFNPLSAAQEHYRLMTDRQICDSKDPNIT